MKDWKDYLYAYKRKRKSNCIKWVLAIIGAIVVLAAIAVIIKKCCCKSGCGYQEIKDWDECCCDEESNKDAACEDGCPPASENDFANE